MSDDETFNERAVAIRHDDALQEFSGNPLGSINRASGIATYLAEIIEKRKLAVNIQGQKYLRVEAWLTLGSLVGVMPRTEWTKQDGDGYMARVEVVRLATGETIGAAESRCDFTEQMKGHDRWDRAEPHACMSMAQTRATSKALAQCLRWIPVLAGYSGTPLEEMPQGSLDVGRAASVRDTTAPVTPEARPASPSLISDGQRKRIWAIWNARVDQVFSDMSRDDRQETLRGIVRDMTGVEHTTEIKRAEYDALCQAIERWTPPSVPLVDGENF